MRSIWIATIFVFLFVPFRALADEWGHIGAQGGVDFGYGQMGDGGGIPYRSMDTLSLRAFPYYEINKGHVLPDNPLRIGMNFSYGFNGQLSSTSSSNGQDLHGHGYRIGVGFGTDLGKFGVLAALNFVGSYTLSTQNQQRQDQNYSGYVGGLVQGTYQALPWLAPSVTLEYGSYGNQSLNNQVATDLPTTIKSWSVAAGLTARFPPPEPSKVEGADTVK